MNPKQISFQNTAKTMIANLGNRLADPLTIHF